MRLLAIPFLAVSLACSLAAEDSVKSKTKSEGIDPVTGDHVKTKSKIKMESDGDHKMDSKTETKGVSGTTKSKAKVRAEGDGDYKEKVKVSGPDGKYESKTKVDK